VADLESGIRLAERGQNVLDWIATHALCIDGEAHLEALFKNAATSFSLPGLASSLASNANFTIL